MPQNDLKNIKAIIWDLDNTLYEFTNEFYHAVNIAAAKAAIKAGLNLPLDKATKIARQSYLAEGQSKAWFIRDYGMDPVQMHHDIHEEIDEKLIRPCPYLPPLFAQLKTKHVIVTHASVNWGKRILDHIGLRPHFADTHIIGLETADFAYKNKSPKMFEIAMAQTNTPIDQTLVVEDREDNLIIPKEMGLRTALITRENTPKPLPNHIDISFNKSHLLLENILQNEK